MFEPTSRYINIENANLETVDSDGRKRVIVYKRRRLIPAASEMTTLIEHNIVQGDRLDIVTARYLGDPLQFWRVCDANTALNPAELEEIGKSVRIAMAKI